MSPRVQTNASAAWRQRRSLQVTGGLMAAAMAAVGLPLVAGQGLSNWDCSDPDAASPIQYLNCGTGNQPILCHDTATTEGHGFYKLDLSTSPASYVSLFTIPKQQNGFEIKKANGVGISPIDSFAYQSVQLADNTEWLIRFGSQHPNPASASFHFVAQIPEQYTAAGFSPNGDLHLSLVRKVYIMSGVQRPDTLTGFSNRNDVTLKIATKTAYSATIGLVGGGNDVALFEINGVVHGMLVRQLNAGTRTDSLVVYKMNPDQLSGSSKEYTIVWEPSSFGGPPAEGNSWGGAGAVWSFKNRVFAANNDGPLYKVDTGDFDYDNASVSQITVHYLGNSVTTANNDGANCMQAEDPWNPCPENADAPGTDASECKCFAGYTGDASTDTCEACEAGKYKGGVGGDPCTDCPANSDSPAASTASTACMCNAGYTGPDGGACEACEAGKYKEASGNATSCKNCPNGTEAGAGSVKCTNSTSSCPAGSTGPDDSPCQPCPANYYKNTTGRAPCTPCGACFSTYPEKFGLGATRCWLAPLPLPSYICGCYEKNWRQAVEPDHNATFVNLVLRLPYNLGSFDFALQDKFKEALLEVALSPEDIPASIPVEGRKKLRRAYLTNHSITSSSGGGACASGSVDVDVDIRVPDPNAPSFTMLLTEGARVRAAVSTALSNGTVNSNLASHGVSHVCEVLSGPVLVTRATNLERMVGRWNSIPADALGIDLSQCPNHPYNTI